MYVNLHMQYVNDCVNDMTVTGALDLRHTGSKLLGVGKTLSFC